MSDQCKVLVFGPQAIQLGEAVASVSGVEFPIQASELLEKLSAQFPALQPSMGVSRLAVNQEYVAVDGMIQAGDEVALIGLISGG